MQVGNFGRVNVNGLNNNQGVNLNHHGISRNIHRCCTIKPDLNRKQKLVYLGLMNDRRISQLGFDMYHFWGQINSTKNVLIYTHLRYLDTSNLYSYVERTAYQNADKIIIPQEYVRLPGFDRLINELDHNKHNLMILIDGDTELGRSITESNLDRFFTLLNFTPNTRLVDLPNIRETRGYRNLSSYMVEIRDVLYSLGMPDQVEARDVHNANRFVNPFHVHQINKKMKPKVEKVFKELGGNKILNQDIEKYYTEFVEYVFSLEESKNQKIIRDLMKKIDDGVGPEYVEIKAHIKKFVALAMRYCNQYKSMKVELLNIYIYSFLYDSAQAYDRGNGESCTTGTKERAETGLVDMFQYHQIIKGGASLKKYSKKILNFLGFGENSHTTILLKQLETVHDYKSNKKFIDDLYNKFNINDSLDFYNDTILMLVNTVKPEIKLDDLKKIKLNDLTTIQYYCGDSVEQLLDISSQVFLNRLILVNYLGADGNVKLKLINAMLDNQETKKLLKEYMLCLDFKVFFRND